jgi:hypothetical protein
LCDAHGISISSGQPLWQMNHLARAAAYFLRAAAGGAPTLFLIYYSLLFFFALFHSDT